MELAKKINTHIINGDACQSYKGLPLLTASPTVAEMAGVPHHLYGTLDASQQPDMFDWYQKASILVRELWDKGKIPLFVGGTGMYLRQLSIGTSIIPGIPDDIRRHVREKKKGIESDQQFHDWVVSVDPDIKSSFAVADRQRLARACEVFLATGKSIKYWQKNMKKLVDAEVAWIILNPPRQELIGRINQRLFQMIDGGAIDEVRSMVTYLDDAGIHPERSFRKIIGYNHINAYIKGECAFDDMITNIQTTTQQYAKRQSTWFRNQIPDSDHVLRCDHMDESSLHRILMEVEARL